MCKILILFISPKATLGTSTIKWTLLLDPGLVDLYRNMVIQPDNPYKKFGKCKEIVFR